MKDSRFLWIAINWFWHRCNWLAICKGKSQASMARPPSCTMAMWPLSKVAHCHTSPKKKRAPLRKNPHPRHGGAHGRLATASSQGPRHSANSGRGMRTPGAHPGTQTGSPAELRPGHHGTSVTSSSSSCPLVPHGRKHATTHCIPVSTIKKTILFHLATLPPYGAMTCCPNPFQPNLPLVALHLPRCPVQISR